jgi:TATA-binding protein-associated factor Taf7
MKFNRRSNKRRQHRRSSADSSSSSGASTDGARTRLCLRLQKGEVAERVHELVSKKELGSEGKKEVWFKFKDSRRAMFGLGDKMYGAKLVDLPCILESQKINRDRPTIQVDREETALILLR